MIKLMKIRLSKILVSLSFCFVSSAPLYLTSHSSAQNNALTTSYASTTPTKSKQAIVINHHANLRVANIAGATIIKAILQDAVVEAIKRQNRVLMSKPKRKPARYTATF